MSKKYSEKIKSEENFILAVGVAWALLSLFLIFNGALTIEINAIIIITNLISAYLILKRRKWG